MRHESGAGQTWRKAEEHARAFGERKKGRRREIAFALVAKGATQQQRTCHNCAVVGHMKRNCWQPGGGKFGLMPRVKMQQGAKDAQLW